MAAKKLVKKISKKVVRDKKEVVSIQFGEMLDTPEKRKQAQSLLLSGRNSEFWNFIKQVLEYNIKETEHIVLEEDELTNDERNQWRWKRMYQMELLNLPDSLIKQLSAYDNISLSEELDPFE